MKKVISGKRYDTETAKIVFSYSSGHGAGDFENYNESLYITKKGSWFLAGEGGPMTKYSRSLPTGGAGGGSDIIPMAEDEVFEYLQSHQDDRDAPRALSDYFSDRIEDA